MIPASLLFVRIYVKFLEIWHWKICSGGHPRILDIQNRICSSERWSMSKMSCSDNFLPQDVRRIWILRAEVVWTFLLIVHVNGHSFVIQCSSRLINVYRKSVSDICIKISQFFGFGMKEEHSYTLSNILKKFRKFET